MPVLLLGVLTALVIGCAEERVTFGTDAYWRLSAGEREGPKQEYLKSQGRRAVRLHEACTRLGTVHGAWVARQFGLWATWTREAERDPILTDHVLTLWAKEYSKARKQRRRVPRTVEEMAGWLASRQNDVTGSWAPPEAPLWLAVGETAEALRLLARGDTLPEVREPMVFLAIMQGPAAAAEVTATTYELASAAGLEQPLRGLAWLPWLRWMTRESVKWDPSWEQEYRTFCNSLLLDTVTGGYRCIRQSGMDITATYRFVLGWDRGEKLLTWMPSPQRMAATIVGQADTLNGDLRSDAASLLVGSIAFLDSIARGEVCTVLNEWVRIAERDVDRPSGLSLVKACRSLARMGAGDGEVGQWLAQSGCSIPIGCQPSLLASLLRRTPTIPTLADLEALRLAERFEDSDRR